MLHKVECVVRTSFLSGGGKGEGREMRVREERGGGRGGIMGEGRVVGYLIWEKSMYI